MNLKKITIISIIFIFLLSSVTHNMYTWFPSKLTALLFPINESIWEHFKMIFTTTLIWGFTLYGLLKIFKLHYHNLISSVIVSAVTNIILTLLLFTPLFVVFGEHIILTLILYLLSTIISQLIAYRILSIHSLKTLNFISLMFILLFYIIFLIFTYYPPHIKILFYDYAHNNYGFK